MVFLWFTYDLPMIYLSFLAAGRQPRFDRCGLRRSLAATTLGCGGCAFGAPWSSGGGSHQRTDACWVSNGIVIFTTNIPNKYSICIPNKYSIWTMGASWSYFDGVSQPSFVGFSIFFKQVFLVWFVVVMENMIMMGFHGVWFDLNGMQSAF